MSELSSKTDEKVPKWIPISLIAVTTVALIFPGALLWRQRQRARVLENGPPIRSSTNSLASSSGRHIKFVSSEATAPPPRRAGNSSIKFPQQRIGSQIQASQVSSASSADMIVSPLYSLGALGLATTAVGVVASACVWGVKSALDVNNVDEFTARMRYIILTRMPSIASKLYGRAEGEEESSDFNSAKVSDGKLEDEEMPWTWAAAEERLTKAYEQGGFSAWLQRAMAELEAENKVERIKRGLQ